MILRLFSREFLSLFAFLVFETENIVFIGDLRRIREREIEEERDL